MFGHCHWNTPEEEKLFVLCVEVFQARFAQNNPFPFVCTCFSSPSPLRSLCLSQDELFSCKLSTVFGVCSSKSFRVIFQTSPPLSFTHLCHSPPFCASFVPKSFQLFPKHCKGTRIIIYNSLFAFLPVDSYKIFKGEQNWEQFLPSPEYPWC